MPVPDPHVPVPRSPEQLAARPDWARSLYLRRIARQMTLQDLSDATGIHLTALSRYECGGIRPGPLNASRIEAVIGTDDER